MARSLAKRYYRSSATDLGQLNMLTKLHLENTAVTDQTLQQVGKLENLEYLNLYGTKVTDAGLENLKKSQKVEETLRLANWCHSGRC